MKLIPLLAILISLTSPARAHEFWIAPKAYQIEPGAAMVADLLVGSDFKGSRQSYFPKRFAQFEVRLGEVQLPVEGRLGDMPAMNKVLPEAGLWVIVHETRGDSLQYRERSLFEDFVAHKDLGDVLERHAARGLPGLAFREAYTLYAKALVGVGDAHGADQTVGLHTEIVALANPYTDDLGDGLPVRLLYEGKPRIDAQVELFGRAPDGEVSKALYRTDANGEATLPVEPGHEYMVNAVV
ncbi:MAG TPA: DUF4198 domain-containing protein, partial [Rhodobacterales bacterium]|nr:DUF4198 domain-containing protein [Rhodobacterales bacterium]